MKYRDSGMPEEAFWESLFDVPLILERLGIDAGISSALELGCGYGTFTLPVAARISGVLHTVDVDAAMVRRTRERVAELGVRNVHVAERDVVSEGFGVPAHSQDACLLFNILHGEQPVALLETARAALRDHGRIFVIHWRHDQSTPRGPSLDIRPTPEKCVAWGEEAALRLVSEPAIQLPPYHFGLILSA